MANRKNILFILPWLPFPLKSGGHQAIYNGIRAIKDHMNIFITYLDYSDSSSDEYLQQFHKALDANIIVLPYRPSIHQTPHRDIISRICRKLNRTFIQWKIYPRTKIGIKDLKEAAKIDPDFRISDGKYVHHVKQLIKTYHIDIVQCEMMCNIAFVSYIPKNILKVFVHHEIRFVKRELELIQHRNHRKCDNTLNLLKNVEIEFLNRYDKIVTLSTIDTLKLTHAGVTQPISSSFATIDTIEKIDWIEPKGNILSFLGSGYNPPNKDGLLWFLENCWKKLKAIDPSYTLRVIGRWPEDFVNIICSQHNDIEFLGFVENLDLAIHNTIMIVPITIGSGIRMKILEAAGRGTPFISTSVGAEGLPVENGVHCIIADTPQDFITGILDLRDYDLQLKFAIASNQMVRQYFSFESLRQNRLSIYQ